MKTPRVPRISHVKRPLRILIGVTLTALATIYILLKIDLEQTWETLASASLWWFGLAVTIMIVTALPMALRWKWLLAAQGATPAAGPGPASPGSGGPSRPRASGRAARP